MTPYASGKDWTLYHGDCLEVLPTLSGIDAVVTDPPYGINFVHSGKGGCLAKSTRFGGVKVIGDDKPFDPAPLLGYRVVCMWGANHYADKLPASARWLIWDKRDGVCTNDQADCEMAWTNSKRPARLIRHLWNGMLKASERGVRRDHPTQKPVVVMRWCLDTLGIEAGATVADPFMGSGTTGVACILSGRNFIGIELDEGYCEIAAKRMREAESHLFADMPKETIQ